MLLYLNNDQTGLRTINITHNIVPEENNKNFYSIELDTNESIDDIVQRFGNAAITSIKINKEDGTEVYSKTINGNFSNLQEVYNDYMINKTVEIKLQLLDNN